MANGEKILHRVGSLGPDVVAVVVVNDPAAAPGGGRAAAAASRAGRPEDSKPGHPHPPLISGRVPEGRGWLSASTLGLSSVDEGPPFALILRSGLA